MLRAIFVCALVTASYGFWIEKPGPRYHATKGEIWPRPQSENKTSTYFTLDPQQFVINLTHLTCPLLERAVTRYSDLIAQLQPLVTPTSTNASTNSDIQGRLEVLNVALTHPCEEYPYLEMVESYTLTVAKSATLMSDSVWGILRGLESFSQLLYLTDDYADIRVNETSIADFPRYAHRGLLLDTSRHFISLSNILMTLDAMAYNKMNVFHWHIVDDQSFPYVSAKFPDLSTRGAFHPRAVYSPADVKLVVESARDRGIRVVPEFDVPGHTRSWGAAYPALLTKCYTPEGQFLGFGPLNPIKNQTYKFLRELFEEVEQVFPDPYLHIGGDEVYDYCWKNDPEIQQYMRDHDISMVKELHSVFMRKVVPQLANATRPIVWQEVFSNGVKLPNGSIVQIWMPGSTWQLRQVVRSGLKALYSACWYLDHLKDGGDWEKFYDCDPRSMLSSHDSPEQIIGGEACMWSEVVDDINVISRVWPRASAVAERLWSAKGTPSGVWLNRRLEEHTCRMLRRGVRAQPPTGPGFCLT